MKERWKKVESHPTFSISDKGRIRNDETGHIRVPSQSANSRYARIVVRNHESHKQESIWLHREVAKAFIPNPENKPEINHINGDRSDNSVANLEWCTRSENMKHAVRTGLCPAPQAKRRPVACFDENGNEIGRWGSVKEASEATGVTRQAIYMVIWRGLERPVKGKIWKKIDE